MCEVFSIFIDYYSVLVCQSVCLSLCLCLYFLLSTLHMQVWDLADSHVYCSIFSLTKMGDLYNIHIVTNHPAFCLNIPQKHHSSRYPASAPQISTFCLHSPPDLRNPAQYAIAISYNTRPVETVHMRIVTRRAPWELSTSHS